MARVVGLAIRCQYSSSLPLFPITEFAISQNHVIGSLRRDICSGVTMKVGCVRSMHESIASCMMLLVVAHVMYLGVGCASSSSWSFDVPEFFLILKNSPWTPERFGVLGTQQYSLLRDNHLELRNNLPWGLSPLERWRPPLELALPPLEVVVSAMLQGELVACSVVLLPRPLPVSLLQFL